MIQISNLTFGYKNQSELFDNLNLNIQPGQIHGLLGLNGAGKSSLLHLIQGLKYTDKGEIKVNHLIPSRRSTKLLEESFLIPEEIYTPNITIVKYIELYAPFYPNFNLESFLKFLNEFEIERTAHLGKMSMGQKKKVVIAFGLATNTKILMMDEPTNGLDIPSKKQFRKILTHIITDNRVFIISTHQIRDLHSLIDNVIVLNEGKVIFDDTILNICNKLQFSLTDQEIESSEILYCERVPGGYLNIKLQDGSLSFEPDIEVLFNAIITDFQLISRAIKN